MVTGSRLRMAPVRGRLESSFSIQRQLAKDLNSFRRLQCTETQSQKSCCQRNIWCQVKLAHDRSIICITHLHLLSCMSGISLKHVVICDVPLMQLVVADILHFKSKIVNNVVVLCIVCSDSNHVRTWEVLRFRGMISTQPGPMPLASFKVLALEASVPHPCYSKGNDIGKSTRLLMY